MTKRLASAAASVAAISAAALALAPSALAYNGGGCVLQGTANFSPNITGTTSTINYTFNGTLSQCQSGNTSTGLGGPTGGSISTPDPVSLTGSCTSSTSSGVAVVQWSDGKTTVEQYTTTGVGALVSVDGTIIASYKAANGTLYTTNEPATPVGDGSKAALTFSTSTPQNCAPGGPGLSSATIAGEVLTGGSA